MNESKAIVILGVFVADTAYRAERQPKMGETILGRDFKLGPGGKGSNQAVAAARLGADVSFITRLGQDAFADLAERTWTAAGVKAAVTHHPDSYTGAAFIFVDDATGNNAIIISPGAAAGMSVDDIEAKAELIGSAAVFLTQLEQPLEPAIRALEIARTAGAATILNPAPAAALADRVFGLCDYIIPNEAEAEALTGVTVTSPETARKAAEALIARGAGTAIVTLGEAGALYCTASNSEFVPAVRAGAVVETTGAGDAFNGGFAAALARGEEPLAAVRFGCAVAGLSVTRSGAAPSMPGIDEVDALLARQ